MYIEASRLTLGRRYVVGFERKKGSEESCLPPTLSLVGIPSEISTLPD